MHVLLSMLKELHLLELPASDSVCLAKFVPKLHIEVVCCKYNSFSYMFTISDSYT